MVSPSSRPASELAAVTPPASAEVVPAETEVVPASSETAGILQEELPMSSLESSGSGVAPSSSSSAHHAQELVRGPVFLSPMSKETYEASIDYLTDVPQPTQVTWTYTDIFTNPLGPSTSGTTYPLKLDYFLGTREKNVQGYYVGPLDAQMKPDGLGVWVHDTVSEAKYEGIWKHGVRTGYAKVFDKHGGKVSEGRHEQGLPKGLCALYTKGYDVLIFSGNMHDYDTFRGSGKLYTKGELEFEGEVLHGVPHGKCRQYLLSTRVEPAYLSGMHHPGRQYGKLHSIKLSGEKERGALLYDGEWKDGKRHGEGREFDTFGSLVYTGEWRDGVRHGKGEFYAQEIGGTGTGRYLHYVGEFSGGAFHGEGKEYAEQGDLLYVGPFVEGLRDGFGVEYHPDAQRQVKFEGRFKAGKRQGHGKLFSKTSTSSSENSPPMQKVLLEGVWTCGKFEAVH